MTFQPAPTVRIGGVDYTADTIDTVQVRRGRDTVYAEPQPGFATIRLIDKVGGGIPITVGDTVTVDIVPGKRVFWGTITDWTSNLYDAGLRTLPAATISITAVGPLMRLNRRIIFDAGRTAELEADRILAAIEDALALTWEEAVGTWDDFPGTWENALEQQFDPALIDPGIFELGPLAVEDRGYNALNVCQTSAASGAGILFETADGFIGFANADRRPANRAAGPHPIPAEVVKAELTATSQLADITNKVNVTYDGGVVSAIDPDSIGLFGTWESTVDTNLLNVNNATARANDFLSRHSRPTVKTGTIAMRLDGIDPAVASDLLDLDINDAVDVPIPTTLGPTNRVGFIEQITTRIDPFRAEIELIVSDYLLSEAAERWGQVPPTLIWDDVLISWAQAITVFGGLPPLIPDNPYRPTPAP